MSTLTRAAKSSSLVGLLLSLGACATLQVGSYTESGADFPRYRTFAIGKVDMTRTGDPRLDNNPFFHDRVRTDVTRMLAARGYEKATGRPDLLVHYHASIQQRIELNDTREERIDCEAGAAQALANGTSTAADPGPANCLPYIYDAGTLVIDVVDARTNKLVWRGWTEGSMDGVAANQELMEKRIDQSVKRILEKLPQRLS